MALVATRKFSIGDVVVDANDHIDAATAALLPAGRVDVLKRSGMLREVPTELPEHELAQRLAELEARVTQLEGASRRRPAPRKRGSA